MKPQELTEITETDIDNAVAIEGSKLTALALLCATGAVNAPILAPVAGLCVLQYALTVGADWFLTGRLAPFPISRATLGDLLDLAGSVVGNEKPTPKHDLTERDWTDLYRSRKGLELPRVKVQMAIEARSVEPRGMGTRAIEAQVIEARTVDVPIVSLPAVPTPRAQPVTQPSPAPLVERRAVPREPLTPIPTRQAPAPHIDSVLDLGQNPQSAIIAGVPGAGKGVFVSNALRELKRANPHVRIFAIDPKDDPKETGYWSIADVLWRKDFDACSMEDAATWYMDRIAEFRRYKGPKLLVSDEGTMTLTVLRLAKVYEDFELGDGKFSRVKLDLLGEFKKFLVGISGMGDSRETWIWIVCQVINCEDLGLTGGVRSIFRSIALVSPRNRNAVTTFFSTGFVPLPPGGKDALYEMMEASACNRAYYDGKVDKWLPTPAWENHSGYDRDTRTVVNPQALPLFDNEKPAVDPWVEDLLPENAIATPSEPVLPLNSAVFAS